MNVYMKAFVALIRCCDYSF